MQAQETPYTFNLGPMIKMGEADLNPRQPAAKPTARSWLLNWGDIKGQKTWENKNLSSDQKMPSLWVRSKMQKCANQKEKHGELDVKLKSFQREKSFDPDKVEIHGAHMESFSQL